MGLWLFFILSFTLLLLTNGFTSLTHVIISHLMVDNVGVYLCLISILFTVTFSWYCWSSLSLAELIGLSVSLCSSIICFTTSNSIVFWFSYEITIIPLVCCIIASSPYSERFMAVWYLLVYVLITSLPMLLIILGMSEIEGSYNFCTWENGSGLLLNAVLLLLFITKVPLPPFHAWLPVVHAEASTYVSIVLSGYVMKLGIIGLIRFCGPTINNMLGLILGMFLFSLVFFISSFSELDNKRWLAFLSLSHIMIAVLALYYCPDNPLLGVVYCVGHGISAGMLFYIFMQCYQSSGTRNWILISYNDNIGISWRLVIVLSLLSVASLPPSISFISEVVVLSFSTSSIVTVLIYCIYLMLGGLLPMLLMAYFLCNTSVKNVIKETSEFSGLIVISLYIVWLLGGLF